MSHTSDHATASGQPIRSVNKNKPVALSPLPADDDARQVDNSLVSAVQPYSLMAS